jgi:hypothetical protein
MNLLVHQPYYFQREREEPEVYMQGGNLHYMLINTAFDPEKLIVTSEL